MDAASVSSIRAVAQRCELGLQALAWLGEKEAWAKIEEWADNQGARLRVWIATLGVYARGRMSIAYRLRMNMPMGLMILQLLDGIEVCLKLLAVTIAMTSTASIARWKDNVVRQSFQKAPDQKMENTLTHLLEFVDGQLRTIKTDYIDNTSTPSIKEAASRGWKGFKRRVRREPQLDLPKQRPEDLMNDAKSNLDLLLDIAADLRKLGSQREEQRALRYSPLDDEGNPLIDDFKSYALNQCYLHIAHARNTILAQDGQNEDGSAALKQQVMAAPNAVIRPKLPSEGVLLERLQSTIVQRWRLLCYRSHHGRALAAKNGSERASSEPSRSDFDERTTIEAPQQQIVTLPTQLEALRVPQVDAVTASSATVVTADRVFSKQPEIERTPRSVVTKSSGVALKDIDFPREPRVRGEEVMCPICWIPMPATEMQGRKWKSHVLRDLSPYFCVFTNCAAPETRYPTTKLLRQHMIETHCDSRWDCPRCDIKDADENEQGFADPAEFAQHLKETHVQPVSESDMQLITEHAVRRVPHTLQACVFCDGHGREPGVTVKQHWDGLVTHMTRDHMQALAMLSLPWDLDISDRASDTRQSGIESSIERMEDELEAEPLGFDAEPGATSKGLEGFKSDAPIQPQSVEIWLYEAHKERSMDVHEEQLHAEYAEGMTLTDTDNMPSGTRRIGNEYGVYYGNVEPSRSASEADQPRRLQLKSLSVLHCSSGPLWCIAFSRDSRTIATGSHGLRIWDTQTGEMMKGTELFAELKALAFSLDGTEIASGWSDGAVRVFDSKTLRSKGKVDGHAALVQSVQFYQLSSQIASVALDARVHLWYPRTQQTKAVRLRTTYGGADTRAALLSPSGHCVAYIAADNTLLLWTDPFATTADISLDGHTAVIMVIAFSADGRFLVSVARNGEVFLWDTQNGERVGRGARTSYRTTTAVAISTDANLFALGLEDGTIYISGFQFDSVAYSIREHYQAIHAIQFSPDGRTIASASKDGTVRLYELEMEEQSYDRDSQQILAEASQDLLRPPESPEASESQITQTGTASDEPVQGEPSSANVRKDSENATMQGSELRANLTHRLTLESQVGPVKVIAFSPDADIIASGSGSHSGMVQAWDTQTGEKMSDMRNPNVAVTALAFSSDNSEIASGWRDGSVILSHLKDSQQHSRTYAHSSAVQAITSLPGISLPGTRLLLSAAEDGMLHYVDENAMLVHRTISLNSTASPDASAKYTNIVISSTGRYIATVQADGTLQLWSNPFTSAVPIRLIERRGTMVQAIAFSADERVIVSISSYPIAASSEVVHLWDTQTGGQIKRVTQTYRTVTAVAISPQADLLVVGVSHGVMHVRDLNTDMALPTLEGHYQAIRAIKFSLDGKSLASASDDGTIRLYDVKMNGLSLPENLHPIYAQPLQVLPNSSIPQEPPEPAESPETFNLPVLPGVLDRSDGTQMPMAANALERSPNLPTSPDGSKLPMPSEAAERHARLPESVTYVFTLVDDTGPVTAVTFSPDGESIATGAGCLRIWDARTLVPTQEFRKPQTVGVTALALSSEGRKIAAGWQDGSVLSWEWSRHRLIDMTTRHRYGVQSVAYLPDQSHIMSVALDGTVLLSELRTSESKEWRLQRLSRQQGSYRDAEMREDFERVLISPNGKYIVSESTHGTLRLWSNPFTNSANININLTGDTARITAIAFSFNGDFLVSAGENGAAYLWDARSGTLVDSLRDNPPPGGSAIDVTAVAISSDAKVIVSGLADGSVHIISRSDRKLLAARRDHDGQINAITFSGDDTMIASASQDGTVAVYKVGWGDEPPVLHLPVQMKRRGTKSPSTKAS